MTGADGIQDGRLDDLHRSWLCPDATTTWADAAYRLLLGRPAEPEAVLGVWRSLVVNPGSRRQFLREVIASREFAEACLIEEAVSLVAQGRPWRDHLAGHTETTERVVEVPWVLERYRGERTVVDIGIRHAPDPYVTGLLRLVGGEGVIGLDVVMAPIRGVHGVAGDLCRLPFADGAVELVTCVSTLEHLGHDNGRYGTTRPSGTPASGLAELSRALRPGGRVLVTVPFGEAADHGWFEQFDLASWAALVRTVPTLEIEESEAFALGPDGWRCVGGPEEVGAARYGDGGVPGARAVLCSSLRRR